MMVLCCVVYYQFINYHKKKKTWKKMLTLERRKVDLRREKLDGDFGDDGFERWNWKSSLGL